jgi:hypothetical protein
MLKRLFGWDKKSASATQAPTPPTNAELNLPQWNAPVHHWRTCFNLHLHGLAFDDALHTIAAKYLPPKAVGLSLPPSMIVLQDGEWITASFAPEFVARIGFNKAASEIAAARSIWLIGYRTYVEEGMDVHYFYKRDHVAGLAYGEGALESEPADPSLFAPLADLSAIMPRPDSLHPLDYHHAILQALGIRTGTLTWADAVQGLASGAFVQARLLPTTMDT